MSNERAFGPWEACSNLVRTCRNEDGSGGFLVAECPANIGNSIGNARLIAAAPELLEALELAKMGLEAAIEKCRANNDSNFLGYALTLDKVNLAIAKARGE